MIESTIQLEISTGVGKLEQELYVGGTGFYKNRYLTGKPESFSILTPIWLATPNFENIVLEFWNTCSQTGQTTISFSLWQYCKKIGGCIIITNCHKNLLQITTAKLLQITTKFCYKLRQLIYYKLRRFYYKLRQLLQIATFITNYDGTSVTLLLENTLTLTELW